MDRTAGAADHTRDSHSATKEESGTWTPQNSKAKREARTQRRATGPPPRGSGGKKPGAVPAGRTKGGGGMRLGQKDVRAISALSAATLNPSTT